MNKQELGQYFTSNVNYILQGIHITDFKDKSFIEPFTGNNDLCYYNFLCSIPVNKVLDFNHIISNIGYMAFGITFLIIVWYKKYLNNQLRKRNLKYIMEEEGQQEVDGEIGRNSNLKGTPQHFGIFFALGLALFAEGALSACYHVCPTNENFQFDTTFMY